MNDIDDIRGFMFLTWDNEVILTSEFVGDVDGDSVAKTRIYGSVSDELAAALVLASVVAVVPNNIRVKLLAAIGQLTATNKKASDDDLPF